MDDSFLYDFLLNGENEEERPMFGTNMIDMSQLSERDKLTMKFVEQYFVILGAMRAKAVSFLPHTLFPVLFDDQQLEATLAALDEAYGANNQISASIQSQIAARIAAILYIGGLHVTSSENH